MYRLLVIGVGSIGERHTRCFLTTGRAEVSICEVGDDLRNRVAADYDVAAAYADLDSALANSFDAAVIATPAPLHIPMATRLAEAGIHLLIEKPLSTSLDGVDTLQETVARSGITASIGYTWRSHPALAKAREIIASGRYGRPLHLVARSGQHFPTYRPAYRDIYYARHESGGGAVQDALTHIVNAGEWLAGPVTRLAAQTAHQQLEGVEVEDTVTMIAQQGDVLASYSLCQHQAPNELEITVVCENGTVRMDARGSSCSTMTEPGGDWDVTTFPFPERDTMYITQANGFLDAVEGKIPPVCTLAEAAQTLRVNLATLRAARDRDWQDI
jgi:predicted dehydrogenase